MNNILFKNARILKMNGEDIFFGDLLVIDNKIAKIDKNIISTGSKIIECNNNLLLPGFKNFHTHSAMTFLRSHADDLSLRDWLYNYVFPMEENLKEGDVYTLSKLAFLEYLTSGITYCFDMYYFPYEIAKAAKDFGMRCTVLGTISDHSDSVEILKKYYSDINNSCDYVDFCLGFHAEYTTSDETLKTLSKLSHELKAPIFTHSSETLLEVEGCKERHDGLTPTQYFDKLGLYDFGGGAFHCNFFDEKDMEIFKSKNLTIVTCPGSNSKLASGVAPINEYLNKGINLTIGTDGPASNNSLDFFKEMYLVSVLQKLKYNDPKVMDGREVLKMATSNCKYVLGNYNYDTLEEGKLADIIMIDLSKPNMQPINNIEKNIVYSGSKENIKMTMINGKILYMNGEFFIDENVNELYKKAQEITDRLIKEGEETLKRK